MIMIADDPIGKDFVIYLQHIGFKIMDYGCVPTPNGRKNVYMFNERRRISNLKEKYETGLLDIKSVLCRGSVPTPIQHEHSSSDDVADVF